MLSKIICHLTSLEDMQQITSGEKLGKSYHRLLITMYIWQNYSTTTTPFSSTSCLKQECFTDFREDCSGQKCYCLVMKYTVSSQGRACIYTMWWARETKFMSEYGKRDSGWANCTGSCRKRHQYIFLDKVFWQGLHTITCWCFPWTRCTAFLACAPRMGS